MDTVPAKNRQVILYLIVFWVGNMFVREFSSFQVFIGHFTHYNKNSSDFFKSPVGAKQYNILYLVST